MSEMKIPKDPLSVDPTFTPPSTSKSEISTESGSIPVKDSMETFSANDLPTAQKMSDIPQLQVPETRSDSLSAYFKAINAAILTFRQQLQASELVDLTNRVHSSQAAAAQGAILLELYEQRQKALAQIEADAKQAMEEIQKKLDEMQNATKAQQDLINKVNAGNAEEKQQYQNLTDAYDQYVKNLKSIGAVDQGNGTYSIPAGAEDKYNAFTLMYQASVDTFNNYWKVRQALLNVYNSATIDYNKNVAANNQSIEDLIGKYNLADYLNKNGYTIPKQSVAGLRDLSGYHDQMGVPSLVDSTPASVSTYPPPSYARSIGDSGPPVLKPLINYIPIDGQKIYDGVYRNLFDTKIIPLNQKIQTNFVYWGFLHQQQLLQQFQDTTPDPLLNTKPLALRILPASFIESSMPIKPTSQTGASGIAMQALGIGNSHLSDILGRAMLKQAIEEANLKIFNGLDAQTKEQKINQLADQLTFLSVGLLSNLSLQALFPSLSLISSSLATLPKDSPAFAILFAVSLINRVQEDAKQGITSNTLETFLKGKPDLADLTTEDKEKLAAILNLGQLLIAAKMLETSLGLPGLLAQILPALSPSIDQTKLLSEASREGKQDLAKLQTELTQHFINQGYPEDKAQFLAQVGSQLTEQGLLTPSATSVNSPQAINQPLLIDSVKAALVLTDYPLTKADSIAHEAINNTLAGAPYHSTKLFRTALESQLRVLGVHDKTSEIAQQAVLIPTQEQSLALLSHPPAASPTAPKEKTEAVPLPPRTPAELNAILEKRSLQVLTPQLGPQIAKQVAEEIAKALFGTTNPDSRDIADVKSPYSLVNAVKDQLHHLHLEENQAWATATSQAFKETIKTMEDFYSFSLKLMDPAYLFVYSANTGIIYGDHGMKRPILG